MLGFKSGLKFEEPGAVATIGHARRLARSSLAILAVNGYEEGARGEAHNLGAQYSCRKKELLSLRCWATGLIIDQRSPIPALRSAVIFVTGS
jgi:hypothetical protein